MLRFALSPMQDMTLNDLRIALFTYILSKQRNEKMIVRFLDSGAINGTEGKDKESLGLLELFGIEYSDVVYQSNNLKFHRSLAIQLLQDKKAFNCFCTPQELEASQHKAAKENTPYRYEGACDKLSAEATIDNENPFTIRLKKPKEAIIVNDVIKGELAHQPEEVDAFVILDAQKYPTANYSSAIDDMLSDISLVIQEEAAALDTPRQIAVRNAINYPKTVTYAHISPLSKTEEVSVKKLLEEGFLPEAIINYLLIASNSASREFFTLQEAIPWFSLEQLSTSTTAFEKSKLCQINRAHLKALDDKELSRYVGFADDGIGRLAKLYLDEASTTKELRAIVTTLFSGSRESQTDAEAIKTLRAVIKAAPYMDTFDTFENYCKEESGLNDVQFNSALRIVLTGAQEGPALAEIYGCIKNYMGEIVK